MFSDFSPSTSLGSRASGIVLGTIVLISATACVVSAKTMQFSLPLLLVASVIAALIAKQIWRLRPVLSTSAVWLAIFLLYAAASSLWAARPSQALFTAALASVITLASLAIAHFFRTELGLSKLHVREGLWMGLLVGVAYSAMEAGSGQAIKMWIYNALQLKPSMLEPARYFTWDQGRIVAIHADDLKRNAFAIPLLLWPALLSTSSLGRGRERVVICSLLSALAIFAVVFSTGQTNALALAAGGLIYVLALASQAIVRAALAAAWLIATLFMVPLVLQLRALELQNADWLQLSAQLRIVIWARVAELVSAAPWFGVGCNMTYQLTPAMGEAPRGWIDDVGFNIAHPHNVYLQVWYELGALGAVLFAVFGLMLLKDIGKLDQRQRPAVCALFAATATAVSSSYNIWQIWLMCLLGFVVAMVALSQQKTSEN